MGKKQLSRQEKVQQLINLKCEEAEKTGESKITTSYGYSWDMDIYNSKEQIIQTIRNRGFEVRSKTSFEVTDITILKNIELV